MVDDPLVKKFTEMGFPKFQVENALESTGRNEHLALDILLDPSQSNGGAASSSTDVFPAQAASSSSSATFIANKVKRERLSTGATSSKDVKSNNAENAREFFGGSSAAPTSLNRGPKRSIEDLFAEPGKKKSKISPAKEGVRPAADASFSAAADTSAAAASRRKSNSNAVKNAVKGAVKQKLLDAGAGAADKELHEYLKNRLIQIFFKVKN